jgi:hypothetical protein
VWTNLIQIRMQASSAIKAAKRKLQAQGLKVNHFSRRDLVTRAEVYLAEHRAELIEEAKTEVERWRASGFFGKRYANINTDAQTRKA